MHLYNPVERLRSRSKPHHSRWISGESRASPYIFQIIQTSVGKAWLPALIAELVDSPPCSLCLLRARARISAQGARWWSVCSAASRMVDRTHFVFIRLGATGLV